MAQYEFDSEELFLLLFLFRFGQVCLFSEIPVYVGFGRNLFLISVYRKSCVLIRGGFLGEITSYIEFSSKSAAIIETSALLVASSGSKTAHEIEALASS